MVTTFVVRHWMLVGLLVAVVTPAAAQGATLVADYNFDDDTLNSSVPGGSALEPIGTTEFRTESVGKSTSDVGNLGNDRVLAFASGGGVLMKTTGLPVDSRTYTLVFRFHFDTYNTSGRKRLVSWFPTSGTGSDSGLYINRPTSSGAGVLEYFSQLQSPGSNTITGLSIYPVYPEWHEVAIKHFQTAVDASKWAFYVDGQSAMPPSKDTKNFGDPETLLDDDGLRFFKDDCNGGDCQETPGAVSRIRLYNGQLTDTEIANLYSDSDSDGVPNASDNCTSTANPNQIDADGDKLGDACDPDMDNDGVPNTSDNCIAVPNPDQADTDHQGGGDACSDDIDGDGVVNASDNCRSVANADQADTDKNGVGDACAGDIDGDGVANASDNCPKNANANQANVDKDAFGDACDPDIDGDGVPNASDQCPTAAGTAANGCPAGGTGTTGSGSVTGSGTPKVTGSGSNLTVDTGVNASCPAGSASCAVTGTITSSSARYVARAARITTLGTLKTTLKPGEKRKVKVKLTKKGAKLLRKAKRLKVKIVVVVIGPDKKPVKKTRTVTLKAPH